MSAHRRTEPGQIDPTGTDARAPFLVETAASDAHAVPDPTGTHAAGPLPRPITAPVEDNP